MVRRALGLVPSIAQVTGLLAAVVAVAALLGLWIGVLVGGLVLFGLGYLAEADR